MNTLNKQQAIGNVGAKPELKSISTNGSHVTTLSVAATDSWKSKTGDGYDSVTTWFKVVFYGKLAEAVVNTLDKGNQVYFEGRTRTNEWTDKAGTKHYETIVEGDVFQKLGGNTSANTNNNSDKSKKSKANDEGEIFTSTEIEALNSGKPIKVTNEDPNKAAKLEILKGTYQYSWKASEKVWSPKKAKAV
ncbi:UNVERIFIED_CONTAM: hypothetical protein GTU68_059249 [Idotea baltica]|nr:hypothetical protein [Idotea baltica]